MTSLFYPMHPVCLGFFGFLSSVFAIAAHDGQKWDLNDHYKHHTHVKVNFALYWGFWDILCGTRYNPKMKEDEGFHHYKE